MQNWNLPTPSAFTADEIAIVKQWVYDGGSLFLIADHMPMAGAATDLAAAFGFEFTNGFAIQEENSGADLFNLEKGTLVESALTKGRIVVFGEAAMFSAQLAGANQMKVGMNSKNAPENFHLLLNIFHWLDGEIK